MGVNGLKIKSQGFEESLEFSFLLSNQTYIGQDDDGFRRGILYQVPYHLEIGNQRLAGTGRRRVDQVFYQVKILVL